jgi:hypothetical protein
MDYTETVNMIKSCQNLFHDLLDIHHFFFVFHCTHILIHGATIYIGKDYYCIVLILEIFMHAQNILMWIFR